MALQQRQVTDDDVAQGVEAEFTDRGEAHATKYAAGVLELAATVKPTT